MTRERVRLGPLNEGQPLNLPDNLERLVEHARDAYARVQVDCGTSVIRVSLSASRLGPFAQVAWTPRHGYRDGLHVRKALADRWTAVQSLGDIYECLGVPFTAPPPADRRGPQVDRKAMERGGR